MRALSTLSIIGKQAAAAALAMVALTWFAAPARAQVAPVGSHQAGRPSDTGFSGLVNSTGGYDHAVPLSLPPDHRGMPVPVSVVYGGRVAGAAGMGWDVPLSYVRRDVSLGRRLPTLGANFLPVGIERLTL